MIEIALIGDYDADIPAHRAIPPALDLAGEALRVPLHYVWLATDSPAIGDLPAGVHGIWCVPGSPYRDMEGAIAAIRLAREQGIPFLGTCGGFQHAVIEYARHALGWQDAAHGETDPDAGRLVVSPLACALVEKAGALHFVPGTRVFEAYGAARGEETYRCSFGLNPAYRDALLGGALKVSARDDDGDVRAVELDGHPYFVATLFQGERAALRGELPPIVRAFVAAATAYLQRAA